MQCYCEFMERFSLPLVFLFSMLALSPALGEGFQFGRKRGTIVNDQFTATYIQDPVKNYEFYFAVVAKTSSIGKNGLPYISAFVVNCKTLNIKGVEFDKGFKIKNFQGKKIDEAFCAKHKKIHAHTWW